MLCVFVMTILVTFVQSTSPSFKDTASDFIQAGFKITTRRGEEKKDYTKLEIEAQPLLMVHDSSSIDKNRVTIEVKSGDQSWEAIDTPPNMRGGVYKWTKSNIVPCVNNNVRIWVHGHDGTPISFDYPNMVNAASFDEIFASGYQPHKPENVGIGKFSGGRLDVTWTPVKCAVSYDVTYQKVMGGKAMSKQVEASHGNSISIIDGLDTCSEYEIRVTAVIGDEYSAENIVTFSTPPELNAAERLEPIINPEANSVRAKWKGFETLSCISEYLVSICNESGECSPVQKVRRDDSLQYIEYRSSHNLDECTEYILTIKPVHSEVNMKNKEINFRTHSQPVHNVAELLTSVKAEIQDGQKITVMWNAIKCADHFEVFKKKNTLEGEWERIGTTQDTFFEQKGVPCTDMKYGVKVTVNDQESEIVDFDQSIKIPPFLGLIERPSLIIEEKTNNSVTFKMMDHEINNMCEVDQYHVKYGIEEDHISPMTLDEGKITVFIPNENTKIEGRIKYKGYDYTPWISSDDPTKERQSGEEIVFLLPIIIGSVIATLVVSLIIFLVVRNKKSNGKYDAEKQEGNTEESKKLNKATEEIIKTESK